MIILKKIDFYNQFLFLNIIFITIYTTIDIINADNISINICCFINTVDSITNIDQTIINSFIFFEKSLHSKA